MGYTAWKIVKEGNTIKFQYPKSSIYVSIAILALFGTFIGVIWGVVLPRQWAKMDERSPSHNFPDFPIFDNNNNNSSSNNHNHGNNNNNNSNNNNNNNSSNNNNNSNSNNNNNNNNNRGSPNATDSSQENRDHSQNNINPNSMMCTFRCDSEFNSCIFGCEDIRYMACKNKCSLYNDFECKECAALKEPCENSCNAKKSSCYNKCD